MPLNTSRSARARAAASHGEEPSPVVEAEAPVVGDVLGELAEGWGGGI